MENLTKQTAEIFDTLLKTALEKGVANPRNLPPLTNHPIGATKEIIYQEYLPYVERLKEYDDFVTAQTYIGDFAVKPVNIITKEFIDKGGFVGIYTEYKKEIDQAEKRGRLEFE
ncbi:MAG: hypothetical protein IH595_11180 [Bacteroidales bacterium]|nr:hypothetical protein [Bacteroidales bacterium]